MHGWRLKRLQKLILTSAVYMESSDHDAARLAADPADTLLWRHVPRRLEAAARAFIGQQRQRYEGGGREGRCGARGGGGFLPGGAGVERDDLRRLNTEARAKAS